MAAYDGLFHTCVVERAVSRSYTVIFDLLLARCARHPTEAIGSLPTIAAAWLARTCPSYTQADIYPSATGAIRCVADNVRCVRCVWYRVDLRPF
jgi:hypothetical protein